MSREVGNDPATQSAVIDAERMRWRLQWLACLQDFADLDLQFRMWLDPSNTNPHWSFVEFMCSYFDDTLHQRDYSWALGQGLVTPREAEAVASLHQALISYQAPNGDDFDNLAVLRDPAWRAITVEAARSLEHLSPLLTVPAEVGMISTA
jgi:hypothetical protein